MSNVKIISWRVYGRMTGNYLHIMRKRLLVLLILLALAVAASAQTNISIPLWPEGAPGALGKEDKDIPTLTVFLPDKSTNAPTAAMVICPGGAYVMLAPYEGKDYARWLNAHGMAGFVLKYRLGPSGYHHPAMWQDAARALRIVRARAGEWGVDPHRVGIMGSSAGGHLASTLLTHFDVGDPNATDAVERMSSRPDLGILCYPVITMGAATHAVSKANLLGTNPPPELVEELSNERQVTTNTPPCFIWSTADDSIVPVKNSLDFATALGGANVPFELHIYEHGPHGLGLGGAPNYDPAKWLPWTRACADWLQAHGFVKKAR